MVSILITVPGLMTNLINEGRSFMQMWSMTFLLVVIAILMLKLYLNYRQIRAIRLNINQVPDKFARRVRLAEHQKAGNYNIAKLKVDNIQELYSSIILLAFTLGGGIELINTHFSSLANNPLTFGVVVIVVYSMLNAVLTLPFGIYDTFGVEQKFGFNKTTVGLFIADMLKGLLIAAVIGIPLLYLVLWLMNVMGSKWWLWVWLVLVVFNLAIMLIYPTVIAPLFNKSL